MYFKKISTGEIIFSDVLSHQNLVLNNTSTLHAYVLRTGNAADNAIAFYENLKTITPTDFNDISIITWNDTKNSVLNIIKNYTPPSNIFYKRIKDSFIYCWNESTCTASVLTNPLNLTSAFLIYSGADAASEIAKRKSEEASYMLITEIEWEARKNQIISNLDFVS